MKTCNCSIGIRTNYSVGVGVPSVLKLTDLIATENDKEYLPADYGVGGFGKVKTELRNLVKVTTLMVSKTCIGSDGIWAGENLIDTSECTKISFYNCDNMKVLRMPFINTEKVTSISECFRYCVAGEEFDIRGWNLKSCNSISYLFFDVKITKVNMLGWEVPKVTNTTSTFYHARIGTLVGDTSVEDIINNNLYILKDLSVSLNMISTTLDRASLRALINGLTDLIGAETQTLGIGEGSIANLTKEDIAIATSKNWTIA